MYQAKGVETILETSFRFIAHCKGSCTDDFFELLQTSICHVFFSQAGQYLLLGWKGEFHPFTLTSAPEDLLMSKKVFDQTF